MGQYVYHFKPKGMTGDVLIPLNALKKTMPATYEEQAQKYKGRETMMENTIPILNSLWNDVLHMSPINPQVILDTWRQEGILEFAKPKLPIEVYKIPVKLLNEKATVCFQSFNYDFDNYDPELQKYWKFDSEKYHEQMTVEAKQIEIWKNDMKAGRYLLWYTHTMHVLSKQTIDTRECELIVCR